MEFTISGLTDIVSASAQHSPSNLVPTFQVSLRPHAPTGLGNDLTPYLDQAVAYGGRAVRVTVGGTTYLTTPTTVNAEFGGGVSYALTLLTKAIQKLSGPSYGKTVVYLSCPAWQAEILKAEYAKPINKDRYVVKHRLATLKYYDGWTVNDIIKDVSQLAGVTLQATFPVVHVQNATEIFEHGKTFLAFIQGLLPRGVQYVWDCPTADRMTLGILTPPPRSSRAARQLTLPPAGVGSKFSVQRNLTPEGNIAAYDNVVIVGGLSEVQKFGPLRLGQEGRGQVATYTPPQTKTITTPNPAVQPPATGGIQAWLEQQNLAQNTRTILYDLHDNLFAVERETTTLFDQQFDGKGVKTTVGLSQRRTVVNTYENHDPVQYETPRLTSAVTTIDGYRWRYAGGLTHGSNGLAWLLTDKGDVMDYKTYDAIEIAKRPTILASAVRVYAAGYATLTETREYIGEAKASLDWPEGVVRLHTQETRRDTWQLSCGVFTLYADSEHPPEGYLRMLGAKMVQLKQYTVSLALLSLHTVERVTKEVKRIAPRSYQFVETQWRLDPNSGAAQPPVVVTTPIDSPQLPSSPTRLRREPLRAEAGKEVNKAVPCRILEVQLNINNPADFAVWAPLVYTILCRSMGDNTAQLTTKDRLYPVGAKVCGGVVTGWTLNGGRGGEVTATHSIA